MKNGKPRLIFFRPTRPGLPSYIQAQLAQQIRCLELSFDVEVVGGSCDFARECDRFEPDLAVFESGAYAGERTFENLDAHRSLPRLGFLNADAYCATRTVFASDMDRWGVEEFFTLSVSMAEYFPAIADRMFVWPNCIDPEKFPVTPVRKNIPVLFTGNYSFHYPWRIRVHDLITRSYPTFTVPRNDWSIQQATMPEGEAYVRLLQESWFAPSCGTIAKDVVRKHFEIPAAGACLVAERTASLAEAGFLDMVNCVFADEHNILDKLDHLFARPEELQSIIDAGRALVLQRHTLENRDQVHQWYLLRKANPGARIVQDGPFGKLDATSRDSERRMRHVVSGGVDRMLLGKAQRAVGEGRLAEAENLYLRCLNLHYMPEAVLGLAKISLKRGDPAEAERWLERSIRWVFVNHSASLPDPVEWAYMARAALCRGDAETAAMRLFTYPDLRHPELSRMRTLLQSLQGIGHSVAKARPWLPSVHDVPGDSPQSWLEELAAELRANGQHDIADQLAAPDQVPLSRQMPVLRTTTPPPAPVRPALLGLRRRLAAFVPKRRLRALARPLLRRGAPSPFLKELTALAGRMDVRQVLVAGTDPKAAMISALIAGSTRNVSGPVALSLVATGSSARTEADARARGYGNAQTSGGAALLVVAATQCGLDAEWFARHEPAFVAIEGTGEPKSSRLLRSLLEEMSYRLVRAGADRGGYAVLRLDRPRHACGPSEEVEWSRSSTAP